MGFLEDLLKQGLGEQRATTSAGGLAELLLKNPQILAAVAELLSSRDGSIGGKGGLGGLVGAFARKGMGDMISSWISTGPNPPISAGQVTDVLGDDTIEQFASKAGVPRAEAGSLLAALLPAVIDQLTPDGNIPEANTLEGSLSSLLG